jgi:hypothetical protein
MCHLALCNALFAIFSLRIDVCTPQMAPFYLEHVLAPIADDAKVLSCGYSNPCWVERAEPYAASIEGCPAPWHHALMTLQARLILILKLHEFFQWDVLGAICGVNYVIEGTYHEKGGCSTVR